MRSILAIILSLYLLSACENRHVIIVAGSTSVQPYAEVLAEEYMILNPEKIIDIQGSGSSAGITAVESGTAEIGMSSRNLKDSEQYLWSVEIARDGLAMIINPRNPVQNRNRGGDIYNRRYLRRGNFSFNRGNP